MAYFEPYSRKVPETWTSSLAEKEKITEGSSPFRPVIEAEQNCLSSHHFLSFSSYISLSPSLSLKRWHWLAHCSPAVNNWCLREAESIGYQYCSEPHRANVQFGKSLRSAGKSAQRCWSVCTASPDQTQRPTVVHAIHRERDWEEFQRRFFSFPTTVIHWIPLLNPTSLSVLQQIYKYSDITIYIASTMTIFEDRNQTLPWYTVAPKYLDTFGQKHLSLKGIVHPKMKNLSSFNQAHVAPNLYKYLSSVEHRMLVTKQ